MNWKIVTQLRDATGTVVWQCSQAYSANSSGLKCNTADGLALASAFTTNRCIFRCSSSCWRGRVGLQYAVSASLHGLFSVHPLVCVPDACSCCQTDCAATRPTRHLARARQLFSCSVGRPAWVHQCSRRSRRCGYRMPSHLVRANYLLLIAYCFSCVTGRRRAAAEPQLRSTPSRLHVVLLRRNSYSRSLAFSRSM